MTNQVDLLAGEQFQAFVKLRFGPAPKQPA